MNLKDRILIHWRDLKDRMTVESLRNSILLAKASLRAEQADKRAFLVLGAESHGSHLATDILINAGCIGHAGNHVPWQPENKVLLRGVKKPWQFKFPTDIQPWDKVSPTVEDPIVWRRSIPHGKQWINISEMIRGLRAKGYEVKVIVVNRDSTSAIESQLKWRHVRTTEEGEANIQKAYLHIFRHLQKSAVDYVLVNYEALALYPQAQNRLLKQLGLNLPKRPWPVYDGNRKWHNMPQIKEVDFPEAWYPCKHDHSSYFERVERGFQVMKESTLVICGLARDVMHSLPVVMKKLDLLGSKFNDYKVVVIENDSNDGSLELLRHWEKINPKVVLISEKLGTPKWNSIPDPERMKQMASCRNRYLDHIRSMDFKFDYLLVFDLDISLGFSYDGLAHTFSHVDWDVVGSNGILVPPFGNPIPNPIFYDAFAFRAKSLGELTTEEINALYFERGEEMIPVESCFGGLAIYKQEAIMSEASYGGEDCEHVVFHRNLATLGFDRQFLNPSQIVLYSE